MPRTLARDAVSPRRRPVLAASLLGLALAALAGGTASAQSAWPDKPVRLVTNFPAGGPLDVLGRQLAIPLQAELGQPFVIDNRPGAGGNIGADAVAKSAPDGYTVLLTIDTTFTINPHVYRKMPFAPKDLKPLMIFSSSGLTLAVNPGVPATGLREFADLGKKQELTFSSAGNGSPGHIASALFASGTGARITHVPYKGNAPAVTALIAGEVQAGILATPGLLPQIQAGKARPLAVTGSQRSPLLPQTPTVAELGLKDLGFDVLYLAMVPAATPDAVVKKLQGALQHALAQPEVKQRLGTLDMVPLGETGQAAADRLEANRQRYGKIVESIGLKLD